MRFLLPPSESKRDGTLPGPVQLDALTAPSLAPVRRRAVEALARRCARSTAAVREAIGVTATQDAELARNAALPEAPVAPAHAVYDGVLFEAIALDACTPAQRQRIIDRTLVQSALFGVVGFGDHIPAYRCSADSTLPRIGRMGTFWRTRMATAMDALLAEHLIIDLRSGTYAAMWTPQGAPRSRTVIVKVMQERGGRRIAVSHFSKATKGQLVRALGSGVRELDTAPEVAAAAASAGFHVTLLEDRGTHVLEVLIP